MKRRTFLGAAAAAAALPGCAPLPAARGTADLGVVVERASGKLAIVDTSALTHVNVRTRRVIGRVLQAGNSIGGAISQDGSLVAAQNYTPGGVRVFDARTLAPVADIPATYTAADGSTQRSRVVGLADLPG